MTRDEVASATEQALAASIVDGRVDAGVAWLDEYAPGWALLVDVDRFDIRKSSTCVLGQVYAPGRNGNPAVGLTGYDWALLHHPAFVGEEGDDETALGFAAGSRSGDRVEYKHEWDALEAAWLRVIRERQAAAL